MKQIATIPTEYLDEDGVKFLVIESDENDSKGFFLFLHQSLDEGSEADFWFLTLDEAVEFAKQDYGVTVEDWKMVEGDKR